MTAGDVANPRPEPQPKSSFIGNLKEQFRSLARVILALAAPAPSEPRRKKREDQTRGGLMMAAPRFIGDVLRRQFQKAKADLVPELPETAAASRAPDYAAATAFLLDTLDFMNPYWDETAAEIFQDDDWQPADYSHLSLHL